MNLTLIKFLCLMMTFCFSSVIAALNQCSKNMKLSGTSSKYASPQLYVFGGNKGDKSLSTASHYNSSTGKWTSTTDMTIRRSYPCGAALGTKVHLFGGSEGKEWLKTAEVYDCETGTYSPYRSMELRRTSCGSAVLDDFIYVAGGYNPDGLGRLWNVIRYNIETTRLEEVTPMHTKRDDFRLLELRGRLYAVGGLDTKTVEMFNPSTNQWTNVASTHFEHKYFGATVHQGGIYVCSNAGCEMYSPDTDKWTTFASPSNYEGMTMVSMNYKLWALGGRNPRDGADTRSVFTYDLFTQKWTQQPDMDVPRRNHVSFVVNH